ncbi:GNAT family N-acetyltransferase [Pseudomonas edaphica]|jgi:GNAT superfamily N-acetyltransferase|uniref:GNAT family N-acetyltransferase n=1 Tax=Pseudomonas edaphica TaxID=2006980 RepID=A0A7Y8E960_9PSED|nr:MULTISPECIES: GNAT family N-acetyltransferase [Pseudomonas]NWC47599.1 GNAT family N-acetyltransferase [Pseudomonas sp. IPO3747]NWE10360.1 GNAT family N-acetyltransferase [Pseudomonas edaphica]NWE80899.1 GNAT family N-acetyltransferase [Pseudomonas edaphica]
MAQDRHSPAHENRLIRQATPDDVRALVELDAYATAHAHRRVFIHDAVISQRCLVVVIAGECAGYLVLTDEFFSYDFVALVVVSPIHQRQGLALQLLAGAEALCKTPKLFASTNASNLASQAMLAKAGFIPSGRIENLDEHDPELVYVKFVR